MGAISAPRTSLAKFANFNRRRDADGVGSIGAVSQEQELQDVAARSNQRHQHGRSERHAAFPDCFAMEEIEVSGDTINEADFISVH
ncbi:hypothetical protein [Paraburkholderia sp. RL17-373-BIF-A]|uniref:hypothetical protein n=1 Tax=Paraburkholderia sp. RL17-373-BIF-A TaxID=3031629 RepID=UPI0038BC0B4C